MGTYIILLMVGFVAGTGACGVGEVRRKRRYESSNLKYLVDMIEASTPKRLYEHTYPGNAHKYHRLEFSNGVVIEDRRGAPPSAIDVFIDDVPVIGMSELELEMIRHAFVSKSMELASNKILDIPLLTSAGEKDSD